jgi:hypothetical protein
MKLRNTMLLAAAVGMAAMIQTARANFSGTLADLVANNGSLTIGDKTFSGFSYQASGLTSFDANNIQVTASIVGDTYYLNWGGSITLASSGPASADLLLGYTVTANPGQIVAIDQSYDGSAQPAGGAFLSVDETAKVGALTVGFSHLQVGDLSDPFAEPGDILTINPAQTTLTVTKDIGLGVSSATGGFVTISDVEQSFEQVPEPTTVIAGALLLLPLGASALRILRKSRAA